MTIKEKLANEYIELRKEFDGDDFKPGLSSNQLWYLVKEFKKYELQDKIDAVKRAIKDKEIRLKREAYFETPEGKQLKKETESKIKKIYEDYKRLEREFEGFVNEYLTDCIGDGWTCRLSYGYNNANIEVGLKPVSKDRKEDGFMFEFGHSFTIYWDLHHFGGKERFDMNYGTLGAFDLDNNNTRKKYLMGMGSFANDDEWLDELKKKFKEYNKKFMENRKKVEELEEILKNPLC